MEDRYDIIGLFCALAISFSYRHGVSQTPRVYGGDPEIHGHGRKAVPNVVHSPPGSEERAGQRSTNDRWLQALKGKRPENHSFKIQAST